MFMMMYERISERFDISDLLVVTYVLTIVTGFNGSTLSKLARIAFIILSTIIIMKNKKIMFDGHTLWMILFTILNFISFLWADNSMNAIKMGVEMSVNVVCTILLFNLVEYNKSKIELTLKALFFSSIVLGLFIITTHGIFPFNSETRTIYHSNGNSMNANFYGIRTSISAVIGFYFVTKRDQMINIRIAYALGMILNILLTLQSYSRKSFIFLLIPIALYFLINTRSIKTVLIRLGILVLLGVVLYIAIMNISILYNAIGARFESMFNGLLGIGETDASTSFRVKMINWGVEWFKEAPIIGHGSNNFGYILGNTEYMIIRGRPGVYAHNNYIELAVNLGVVGLFTYYVIYVLVINKFLKLFKKSNNLQIIMVGILVSFLIADYGDVTYYMKYQQLVIWICWVCIGSHKYVNLNLSKLIKKNRNDSILEVVFQQNS